MFSILIYFNIFKSQLKKTVTYLPINKKELLIVEVVSFLERTQQNNSSMKIQPEELRLTSVDNVPSRG